MLPKHHLLAGIFAAIILYPFFGLKVFFIAATSALLDIDHFLIYLYRLKKFDLKNAYAYFKKVKDGSGFYPIFHMFEFFSIILFAALYFNFLFLKLIALGQIIHIMQDFFEELFSRRTRRNFFAIEQILNYLKGICSR